MGRQEIRIAKILGRMILPFSGVGIGHDPLWSDSARSGVMMHEFGYLESNQNWKFPSVFGPFWRLKYQKPFAFGF